MLSPDTGDFRRGARAIERRDRPVRIRPDTVDTPFPRSNIPDRGRKISSVRIAFAASAPRDYWGKYSYDLRSGTITLTADNGNNVPGDLDLDGSFRIAEDVLKFENLSLGTKDGYRSLCGMSFVRY